MKKKLNGPNQTAKMIILDVSNENNSPFYKRDSTPVHINLEAKSTPILDGYSVSSRHKIPSEIELIRAIIKFHPVLNAGVKRGWSMWAKGAYGGNGSWDYLKLIYASQEELFLCWEELEEENKEFKFEWEGN